MAKFDTEQFRANYDELRGKYQKLYAQRMPILRKYDSLVNETLHSYLGETMPAAASMFAQAKGLGDVYSGDFVPATQRYLKSAEGYDTPDRREAEAGRAMADVTTAGETARQGALARLENFGIDPSQTRNAALDKDIRVKQALEAVKAGQGARLDVEERGRAYTADALSRGSELLGGELGLSGAASGMAASGVNATNQAMTTSANVFGTPGANLAAQRDLVASSVAAKEAEAQFKAGTAKGSPAAGIGSMVGMAAGAYLGSYGGPAGMMAGASLGSQLGGAAGGSIGGGGAPAGGGGAGAGGFSGMPTSWDSGSKGSGVTAGMIY